MDKDSPEQVKFELILIRQAILSFETKAKERASEVDDYFTKAMFESGDYRNLLWRKFQLEQKIDYL